MSKPDGGKLVKNNTVNARSYSQVGVGLAKP